MNSRIGSSSAVLSLCILVLLANAATAHHLGEKQCQAYFECVLGPDSALNKCYDNKHLKENKQDRVMCMRMRMAQYSCKKQTGILGTGRRMTAIRPVNKHKRPTYIDFPPGVDQDIEIYNYAGWNHCPPRFKGLQDFWCDPKQLRYPPDPWCDVIPIYNIEE